MCQKAPHIVDASVANCENNWVEEPRHFIGIVADGVLKDLYSEFSCPAESGQDEGAIWEKKVRDSLCLAEANSAEAALYKLAAARKLCPLFPPEVELEVQALLDNTGISDPELHDMLSMPFVTIDGADSLDLDQALYVQASGEGHIVHYALANASYYVRPGTALHAEALLRGASYYMPGFMIPMLPRALSEGLVSLNANVLRRALVFSMTLDAEGRCTDTKIRSSRIRSRGKLSFKSVQKFYAGGPGFGAAVDKSLHALSTVGQKRMRLAEERGVVRYRRNEIKASLASGGIRFTAENAVRHEVELYNEQLSLLCNIEGARYLSENGSDFVEPIYRVHPAPSTKKMNAFETMLHSLLRAQGLSETGWHWSREGDIPLRQYLEDLPDNGPAGRIAMAIHRQAVMANVRSNFQTEVGGHHGVSAPMYARFSAPMREMVGVFLHGEILEAQAGHGNLDPKLRSDVVSRANAARSLQASVSSKANQLVLDQLFSDAHKSGSQLAGTLMGTRGKKAYVRLDEPPIDVKVYLNLSSEPFRPSKDGTSLLRGKKVHARLGDLVLLRVIRRDETRDRWILDIDAPQKDSTEAKPRV